jgi:SGNH domain (fused to AT3 domains)
VAHKARMLLQPCLHVRLFMRAIIVEHALVATTERLLWFGKRVILLADIPEMNFPVADCAERPLRFVPPRQDCFMALDAYREQTKAVARIFAAVRKSFPEVRIIESQGVLCGSLKCYARTGRGLLYMADGNHLTYEGARLLGKWLIDTRPFSILIAKP